jgi:hypothetical protein
MSPRSHVSMPIAEIVTLLEASLLFVIQLLIARHPELLAAPEEAQCLRPDPPLYGARRILAAVRELNNALDGYRAVLHQLPRPSIGGDDDFPFP